MASHETSKLPRVDVVGTAWTETDMDVDGTACIEVGDCLGVARPRQQQAANKAERNQASEVSSDSHVALHSAGFAHLSHTRIGDARRFARSHSIRVTGSSAGTRLRLTHCNKDGNAPFRLLVELM